MFNNNNKCLKLFDKLSGHQ